MKCEFCSAEWEGESTICPECGKDNAPAPVDTVPVEEIPTPEIPEPKKMSAGRIALLVVLALAAIAVVVALVFSSLKGKPEATEPATEPTTEAVEAQPGDPNTVAAKASYTVSDEEAIAAHDKVVATMGDRELTNGMLQVYYWMTYYDFMRTYGNYASYFGLDTSVPLDQQDCPEGGTWQQYFLDNALSVWQQFQSLMKDAEAEGFTLSADNQALIDQIPDDLGQTAASNGYETVEALLLDSVGPGITVEDYQQYMYQYQLGYLYYEAQCDKVSPTDAEVEAYFNDNEETFADNGVTRDTATIDVRHILFQPTDKNEDGTYPDAAWEACKEKAEALLEQWKNGEATEEAFAALAAEQSEDPGSASNGGLYTGVTEGQMVAPFEDWCFDATRQPGDSGLVKTDYGYHIMYFVGKNTVWFDQAKSALVSEQGAKILSDIVAKNPLTTHYTDIVLGDVPAAIK